MCLGGVKSGGSISEPKELKSKLLSKSSEEKNTQEISQDSSSSSSSKISDKSQILGEMKKISKYDPANPKVNIGKIIDEDPNHGWAGDQKTGCFPMPRVPGGVNKIDLGGIIAKMNEKSTQVVENIRNSKGEERDSALLNFQNSIDKMPEKDLKGMRNHLVKEMSSETNKDDKLLGALLNSVNKEIDSRENFSFSHTLGGGVSLESLRLGTLTPSTGFNPGNFIKQDSHSNSHGQLKPASNSMSSDMNKMDKMSDSNSMNSISSSTKSQSRPGSPPQQSQLRSEAPQQAFEFEEAPQKATEIENDK